MLRYAQIGSVSSGTLKSDDLLDALHDELEYQLGRQERTPENREQIDRLWDLHGQIGDDCYDDDGNVIDDLCVEESIADLIDAMNEFTPPYVYFGAHEGDGADFGYWPSWDAIDELPKYDDHADVPVDIDGDYAIVNDHGNVSVYSTATTQSLTTMATFQCTRRTAL